MVTIANPIYDSVFKFLMQDTKVAIIPKNKLEEILSDIKNGAVFQKCKEDQMVKIEDYFDKSEEYQLIVRGLQEAALDTKVRKIMNDEYDLMRQYKLMKENERLRIEAAEKRGEKKGRAEALKWKLEIAKNLKSMGMPLEQITAITNLSAEEISAL